MNEGRRQYADQPGYGGGQRQYEFQVILHGHCWPDFGGGQPTGGPTLGLWVFPLGSDHTWLDRSGQISRILTVQFREVPEILRRVLKRDGALHRGLGQNELERVAAVYQSLFESYRRPTPLSPLVFERGLLELVLVALQNRRLLFEEGDTRLAEEKVAQSRAWYGQHLGEAPSIEEVAAGVFTSPRNLRRYFEQVTGRSPRAVFHEIRMKRAIVLVQTSGLPLEEIAFELGFSELSAFSRAFKVFHNRTPSSFRR